MARLARVFFVSLVVLALPIAAAAITYPEIQATDLGGNPGSAEFTFSNGKLTVPSIVTKPNGNPDLTNSKLFLDIELNGPEEGFVIGTDFVGAGLIADVYITNAAETEILLMATVTNLSVTNISFGPGGSVGTSVNIGGISEASQSEVTLIGGTQAASFGGIGTTGQMQIDLFRPDKAFGHQFSGGTFSGDFNSSANVAILFHTPEPGTAMLVSGSLLGMALWRRRLRIRRRV